MTFNDLETNERCMKIRQLAELLPKLMRDGPDHQLFMALSDIELNARDCQYHLNDLYSKAGRWHPLREPMGS